MKDKFYKIRENVKKRIENTDNKKLSLPQNLWDLSVLILFIAFIAIRDIPIFLYAAQIFFLIMTLINIIRNKKINNIRVSFSWGAFVVWVLLSFIWASSMTNAIKFFKEIIQIAIISSGFAVYCSDKNNIKKALEFAAISSVFMIFYTLVKTPIKEWITIYNTYKDIATDAGRLGYSIGVHPNTMGALCVISIFLWGYVFKEKKIKTSILWIILSFFLLLFTKSRAAFIELFIIGYLPIAFANLEWKKILIRTVIYIITILIFIGVSLNVPFLYRLYGSRFEGLSNFLKYNTTVASNEKKDDDIDNIHIKKANTNTNTIDTEKNNSSDNKKDNIKEDPLKKGDASVTGRKALITVGLQIIKDYTILGVGAGNYANIAYNNYGLWREVYSHTNYIEMFADLGVIGFIIYYLPRFWVLIILVKKGISKRKDSLLIFLLSFCITYLALDFIRITYSSEFTQLIYTICFCYILIKEGNKKNKK